MRYFIAGCLLWICGICSSVSAQELQPGLDHTMYRLPIPGGFVVTPDLVHLIVSQPESAELVYFDSLKEKVSRRVALEFQPGTMAIRDDSLFVTGVGASVIYELNWKSGKVLRQIVIPGDGISHIAAHPKRPLVFVSTNDLQVFAVDMGAETSVKTRAVGDHLAVSSDGEFLFTGTQPRSSSNGVLHIKETPGGDIHFIYDSWGVRSVLAKFKIDGPKMTLVSAQPNASVNGYRMHLSPDGKRLVMPGGGGWRPPVDGGTGGGYQIAVFDTGNLLSKLGQAPHGEAMIYHPVLNVAAISGLGHNLLLCDGKSFKEREKVIFSKGGHGGGHVLAFVGKGTKVALYNGANPKENNEGLHFFDIELSKEERSQLAKVYGPLPKPVTIAAVPKAEVDETKPESTPKSAASPSRIKSKSKGKPANDPVRTARVDPPKELSSQTVTPKAEPMTELPKGVIAMTGFNDAKGINSNPKRNSPYPLGIADAQGGSNEKGWQSAWPSSPNTTFVSDIVAEGDGALHLKPTTNSGRQWSKPIAAPFKIETMVRCPAGGGVQCYVWDTNYTETGPMWNAMNGKFGALDGDGKGAGKTVTICDCKPDTWYKVTLEIDPAERRWTMSVDGQKSETKFGFRHDPAQLQGINFLVEGRQEIYLDAIRILSSDQDK